MDPAVQIKITSSVCSSVAVASTIYRLFIRRGRFWADDAWALFSMIVLIIQVVAVFLDVPNPKPLSQQGKITRYYLMASTFYCVIWSARLSILFSMIRIDPSQRRRTRLLCIAVLFFLVWTILVAQLFWVCEPHAIWKLLPTPQCPLNGQVAISQLVSDVVADTILLIAPLRLLASIRDKWLRYRLMIIFSTCIVTTVVSLVHAVYILTAAGAPRVIISALVEDPISLIVCNVPVVVASIVHLGDAQRQRDVPLPSLLMFATLTRPPASTIVAYELSQDISNTHTTTATQKPTNSDKISLPQKPRVSVESVVTFDGGKRHQLIP
ncbi:hypothetical protein Hypma_000322 [Hypsizygus marmoreus]|uniref:Rhodopsin domain-containing protein n=1 Tax=Hypsizygus marmoreus TaxID=39966 RepID=A0A369JFT8_HYPMA|nr:hypothetical protein Hypma_000322 [Hypsizygus marmoreus]